MGVRRHAVIRQPNGNFALIFEKLTATDLLPVWAAKRLRISLILKNH